VSYQAFFSVPIAEYFQQPVVAIGKVGVPTVSSSYSKADVFGRSD